MRAVLFFLITLSMAGAFPQKASRAGMAQCIACPAGTYTSGGSATGCATCPANYYCPGASDKLACPAGATAAAGAANKNDCKALPIGTGLGGQYCAATNKNECTANAAWAGGSNVCYSNSSTYTAWDGSSVTYTSPYKARQNSYSIQASTWACTTSSSTAPNAASDAQCRSGQYCWCAYSKSPDTSASTFSSGIWSSWVLGNVYSSAADCADTCAVNCAIVAYFSSYGGAVAW